VKRLIITVLAIVLLGVGVRTVLMLSQPLIDPSFATEARVRFDYGDRPIDVAVTDQGDLESLKEIAGGRAAKNCPACSFEYISITLTNGQKSITFWPACDGDPLIRVNDSDRYVRMSGRETQELHRILAKYGIELPHG